MGIRRQSARAKYDDTYQKLRLCVLEEDYDRFWDVIHKYENKRLLEAAKFIIVWALILVAAWYLGLKYLIPS